MHIHHVQVYDYLVKQEMQNNKELFRSYLQNYLSHKKSKMIRNYFILTLRIILLLLFVKNYQLLYGEDCKS